MPEIGTTFEKASDSALKINTPITIQPTSRTIEMDDLKRELKRLTDQKKAYEIKIERDIAEVTAHIVEAEKLGIKGKLEALTGGIKP
jgi:type II secretory pathway component GspD/PulD (secretin)